VTFGDEIRMITPVDAGGADVIANAASRIPHIVPDGMPAAAFPQHLVFLLRATYAALECDAPAVHHVLTSEGDRCCIATVVAVRVGMLLAMGPVPEAERHCIAAGLAYDPKRGRLWVRAGKRDEYINQWRLAYAKTVDPPPASLEIMLMWCKVAPMIACMASCTEYALGGGYAVQCVQEAISRFMRQHMSPAAYHLARLDRQLTWDAARAASIAGYPKPLVRVWSFDPLMAVCAERRIMVGLEELSASRAREARLSASYTEGAAEAMSDTATASDPQDVLWKAVAAARGALYLTDDDAASVATILMEDASMSRVASPAGSDGVRTARPSAPPTPPNEMSPDHRDQIRAAIRDAASSGQRAASDRPTGADVLSVRW